MRLSTATGFIVVLAWTGVMAAGCAGSDKTSSDEELQLARACQPGALDALSTCIDTRCNDGSDRLSCVQQNCLAEYLSLEASCQSCLLDHASDTPEVIDTACTAAPVACFKGELDSLAACVDTQCADATDLAGCVAQLCSAEFTKLSGNCQGCVLEHHTGTPVEIAAICEGAVEPFACTSDEIGELGACVTLHCSDTTDLPGCVTQNCLQEFAEMSSKCQGCVFDNQTKSPQEIGAICAGEVSPFACGLGELDALSVCVDAQCADATDLAGCVTERCLPEFAKMSSTCQGCVIENQAHSPDDIGKICAGAVNPFACTTGELDPLTICVAAQCSAAPDLPNCVALSCGTEFLQLTGNCQTCVLNHQTESPDQVGTICTR